MWLYLIISQAYPPMVYLSGFFLSSFQVNDLSSNQ